jgi:hypothetical protein
MLISINFGAFNQAKSQETPYELKGKNYTATYEECIEYYKQLDQTYRCVSMIEAGDTDAGLPLHTVLISSDGRFDPARWKQEEKIIILINNGIHPGEPDGIDASMMLARDLAENPERLPDHIAIAIIPVYNIGGCLLRSAFNRVDQNGPEAFGERGNAQNLDLNRDFIKCDSKESITFASLFRWLKPDIFIDNHVSDGADYQHVITLATTQHNKLGGKLGAYLNTIMEPALYEEMSKFRYPMIPYVNVWGKDARDGWTQFFDAPRFSTGYTTLFQTIGFTIETHMLKPYDMRVDATYQLMQQIIQYATTHSDTILQLRQQDMDSLMTQTQFAMAWEADSIAQTKIELQGYTYIKKVSDVSGLEVAAYDRKLPYTAPVPFYNTYKPSIVIDAPDAYIIPQGWWKVISRLKANQVELYQFESDTICDAETYEIINYQAGNRPFEGHHLNSKTEVQKRNIKANIRKGDWYIPLQQSAKRFIVEVLEPQGNDSYFAWNFFDAILIQKEGYSDYAFETDAAAYLRNNPELREALNEKKESDTSFASSAAAQLEFVYKNSPYCESRFRQYPVLRVQKEVSKQIQEKTGDVISGESVRHDE